MANRLFVAVMGHQNSGKSETWNHLFGRMVRRGSYSRHLPLRAGECVEVFLVSGSFEERNEYAGDVLDSQDARVVLCSIQYAAQAHTTLDYAFERGFDVYVQWLNPGFHDGDRYFDRLGFAPRLLDRGATLSLRDGKKPLADRAQEIREFIYGWAIYRGLIVAC